MTIAGALPRPSLRRFACSGGERRFRVDAGTSVLARVHPGSDGAPALVLCHGLTGSADSPYLVGTAAKAHARGLTAVRLNARNCGGTEALTESSYHADVTGDVLAVARELAQRDGAPAVVLAGFSLGGNVVLRLAGELGADAPPWLAGVVAVSPCVDFGLAADALERGPVLRAYRRRLVHGLRRILRARAALHPGTIDLEGLKTARTLREFDARYTAPLGGFDGVEDYYRRASARALLRRIALPTLILSARNDPLVPFASFDPELPRHPAVRFVAPELGGHVAFLAARRAGDDPDRRWAENRVVDFASAHAPTAG